MVDSRPPPLQNDPLTIALERFTPMPRSAIDSTGKIREKKRQFIEREQRILAAAIDLLVAKGIDRVTVSSIASRAGIGKGTIYKHFLTKTEILMRIMVNYETMMAERLRQAIAECDAGDNDAVIKAYLLTRLENPALDKLVQELFGRLESEAKLRSQMDNFYQIRRANIDAIKSCVIRQTKQGILEDVPTAYHYLASWALAQGAIEVLCNPRFAEDVTDRGRLIEFISGIGVNIGKRGLAAS